MATWSRSQSQEAGMCKGASSGMKVSGSHDLVRNERIRLANKKENARIARWAEEAPDYKKVRKYSDTIVVKLSRKTTRSLNGRVLSSVNKAAIASKRSARDAFFAELAAFVRAS